MAIAGTYNLSETLVFVENRTVMCAIFAKVWFYGAKNSISASDSLQTESPIKLWAIHTPTLLDNYALLKILL